MIHEQAAHVTDKADGNERGNVKEKHSQLTKELLEVRNKVHHLEKEIIALQKEILEAGNASFLFDLIHLYKVGMLAVMFLSLVSYRLKQQNNFQHKTDDQKEGNLIYDVNTCSYCMNIFTRYMYM